MGVGVSEEDTETVVSANISNCQTNILAIFRGIFILSSIVFQNSSVCIPLDIAEPLTMFCGTLRFRGTQFEKH